jgi:hypothetical protein
MRSCWWIELRCAEMGTDGCWSAVNSGPRGWLSERRLLELRARRQGWVRRRDGQWRCPACAKKAP